MHPISIHNSLADVGLYWFAGICKDSVEIATSPWFMESFTRLLGDGAQPLGARYLLAARITAESTSAPDFQHLRRDAGVRAKARGHGVGMRGRQGEEAIKTSPKQRDVGTSPSSFEECCVFEMAVEARPRQSWR